MFLPSPTSHPQTTRACELETWLYFGQQHKTSVTEVPHCISRMCGRKVKAGCLKEGSGIWGNRYCCKWAKGSSRGQGGNVKLSGRDRRSPQISSPIAMQQVVMLPGKWLDSIQIQEHQAQRGKMCQARARRLGQICISNRALWPGEITSLGFPDSA